jgi:hypothetical protein
MRVYIKNHPTDAGHWIYNNGYFSAWKSLGYEATLYNQLNEIDTSSEYYLMAIDADITSPVGLSVVEKAKRTWLYTQPNTYPGKWGKHPNFITSVNDVLIDKINLLSNVVKWSFLTENETIFSKWGKVHSVPLAFDSIGYLKEIKPYHKKYHYDICYIGGRANNGFDEKYRLIQSTFEVFNKFNSGFFVERSLSLPDEANILFHSEVGLNVHDVFQREYGFDTNERTFKTLGLTGLLASDMNKQLEILFGIKGTNNLEQLVDMVKGLLELSSVERKNLKDDSRGNILKHHTYVNRVESLLSL